MSDIDAEPKQKQKKKIIRFQLCLSDEEQKMIDELKGSPHFVNVQEFLREVIRKLHAKRTGNGISK